MSYRNPVIPGFYPDPSVCRVGDEYYLAASSFTYFPGVPLFRSHNLVGWTQIGNILDRPALLDLSQTHDHASLGVFAPTLRHHAGRFWMITTVFSRAGGPNNFFVTADDPAGPWADPIHVNIAGIDPDLAWDAAGCCWVHYSTGQRIERCRIDPDTGALLEGPKATWSGTGLQYPEAPHLFQRNGMWYLLIAEGGTERGHAVSIARGPSPMGPWQSCPANPILSHRSTNLPIQNTGHADLVEAVDGSWWMVLLGVRPRGMSPRFHVLGRETFLAPVGWVDGWPRVTSLSIEMEARPPGPAGLIEMSVRDDFDATALHPRWIAVRQPPSNVASLSARAGWLTLFGADDTLDSTTPVFIGRRQQQRRPISCSACPFVTVQRCSMRALQWLSLTCTCGRWRRQPLRSDALPDRFPGQVFCGTRCVKADVGSTQEGLGGKAADDADPRDLRRTDGSLYTRINARKAGIDVADHISPCPRGRRSRRASRRRFALATHLLER